MGIENINRPREMNGSQAEENSTDDERIIRAGYADLFDMPQGRQREPQEIIKRKDEERSEETILANLEARVLAGKQKSLTEHEEVMRTHEAVESHVLGGGANITELVKIKDDGSVVFKPSTGERSMGEAVNAHIEPGTYYKRERAAYLVSEYFEFKLVPPTVIREIDGKVGSAQEFVPDTQPAAKLYRDRSTLFSKMNLAARAEDRRYKESLTKLFVLDHLIWNTDRRAVNFLLKEDGGVVAIDNGLAFNRAGEEGELQWYGATNFYDREVPQALIERFKEFASNPEAENGLRTSMEGLLSQEEVDALVFRAKQMAVAMTEGSFSMRGKWNLPFKETNI